MSTATATRTTRTIARNEDATAESPELLNQGASVMQQLRLNGIEQRDKEIVVINMLNRINNDARPEWGQVMALVRERAADCNVSTAEIVGRIVDHLFEQLGPVRAS